MENVSLTTTLPYVNSKPHIGFAVEIIRADVLARFFRAQGKNVFFSTGTDEHGVKIYQKAQEENENIEEYVKRYAEHFMSLKESLNLSYNAFIRTTDEKHKKAAQEFWKRCKENGDIYKKYYSIKYCVGCELEKTDSELDENGDCPLHKGKKIELIEEENYFFRFSRYEEALTSLLKENPDFIIPASRKKEAEAFLKKGLQDFSISRIKEKMPWGIPVPEDEEHVMYVWFDALVNYLSTLNWPKEEYKKWWPSLQLCGKDNLRQQSLMWQAMLMSAKIEPSKQIMVGGFILNNGEKMSKSLGNVVDPLEIVENYSTDSLRYFLLRHIHPFEDSDFTQERFYENYTAHLVNGLGNVVSRVLTLSEKYCEKDFSYNSLSSFPEEYISFFKKYSFNEMMDYIWSRIQKIDERMTKEEPFKIVKTEREKGVKIIQELVQEIYTISYLLEPCMPETSEKIKKAIEENKKPESLFPRKEKSK
jgi:methionyl-tRNA synthetase